MMLTMYAVGSLFTGGSRISVTWMCLRFQKGACAQRISIVSVTAKCFNTLQAYITTTTYYYCYYYYYY